MSNIDVFGVKRGSCKCKECPQYCFSKENLCSYCSCTPAKHSKLDDQSNETGDLEETENSNKLSTSTAERSEHLNVANFQDDNSISGAGSERTSSSMSNLPTAIQVQVNKLTSLIPESFYDNHEADVEAGLYSKTERNTFNRIVRILADRMMKAHCTSKSDVLQMSVLAIERFPGLKGVFRAPHERIEKSLLNCIKNKKDRENPNKKKKGNSCTTENDNTKESNTSENVSDLCTEMLEECSYLEKDVPKLKELLSKTREARKHDSETLSAKNLLTKYPALNEKDLEIVPSKAKAPTLIAADEEGKQLKFYVDSEPLHCTEPLEALLLLIACYYVFNISYEKEHKLQFILLETIVFGNNVTRISPGNTKYLSVQNILERSKVKISSNKKPL